MEGVDWKERHSYLSSNISTLIRSYLLQSGYGLDIGCGSGSLTKEISRNTGITFLGIDPYPDKCTDAFSDEHLTARRDLSISEAWSHTIPFAKNTFSVVVLASVYEHILPKNRKQSIQEIYRVLKPGGLLVGQIPNMNFPIENHSNLPFQQFLPQEIGDWYFRKFSKNAWKFKKVNWYRVGIRQLTRDAEASGFKICEIRIFNYPKKVYPEKWRRLHFMLSVIPTGFVFSYKKPLYNE